MLGRAVSAVHNGIQSELVYVEADVSSGFPRFSIVGLPDSAVNEARLRIRSAFHNCSLPFPKGRITVNLQPASLRKQGSGLDLAIAIAILRAEGMLVERKQTAFLAELGLDGSLVPAEATVGLALRLAEAGIQELYVAPGPPIPGPLASLMNIVASSTLTQVVAQLTNHPPVCAVPSRTSMDDKTSRQDATIPFDMLDSLPNRAFEKRLLAISAAGRHPLLFIGPPGVGKTTLSHRLIDLLPNLSEADALRSYAYHELVNPNAQFSLRPPLREPHHTLTPAGLTGSGSPPRPGEVTLADNGVLLLDECFEFSKATLNALREPLTSGVIHVSRNGRTASLPARFLLVGTANPCPCGWRGYGECRCLEHDVRRYWSRCPGPLLDRIDLIHYMNRVPDGTNNPLGSRDPVAFELRQAVSQARAILEPVDELDPIKQFQPRAVSMLTHLCDKLCVTERVVVQTAKLARTIAALDRRDEIRVEDVEEAFALRSSARR
ncbi:magnesium chelatase family protein [Alicyclobacillus hesperidum]|uniref:Magnesium chelatase family protein n=1 Tax=Alicyclobacillus hesperidum TaxID=89784 RepID=A0A1H2SEP8_9BACL|nr:ATP-binding protein [Alicyclobacillus hesperidum]SDW29978.1 magnesium chelatase family protein [Alicyclobacillus hesperidum]